MSEQGNILFCGVGGQGILLASEVTAYSLLAAGMDVRKSEVHGMAQRGGTVLSTIKVGDFASPLIRAGQAEVGLMLWEANLPVHKGLLKADGKLLISAVKKGEGERIDAAGIAREIGNPVLSNLVMLGLAVKKQALFCTAVECEEAIRQLAPARFVEQNLSAFHRGLNE